MIKIIDYGTDFRARNQISVLLQMFYKLSVFPKEFTSIPLHFIFQLPVQLHSLFRGMPSNCKHISKDNKKEEQHQKEQDLVLK